jgi:type VI secretion system protein ImpJ
MVISTNVVTLPFEKRSEVVSLFRVPDDQLFRTAQFVLTVSGEKAERMVIDEVPRKVKIAAPDVIDQLVVSARPGLGLMHAAVPPVGLPTRAGLQYFRLEKSGPLWDGICRTGILALFIPAEFKSMQLKLLAVKEKF